MGKGSSPKVAKQEITAPAVEAVTPAIARSIAQDTETAQSQQLASRQRMRGVSSTYLRGANLAATTAGKQKLGQ